MRLAKERGNVSATARDLGLSSNTLQNWNKQLEVFHTMLSQAMEIQETRKPLSWSEKTDALRRIWILRLERPKAEPAPTPKRDAFREYQGDLSRKQRDLGKSANLLGTQRGRRRLQRKTSRTTHAVSEDQRSRTQAFRGHN